MARDLTSVEEYRRLVAGVTSEDDLLVDVASRLTLGRWRWTHVRRSDKAVTMGDPGIPDILAVRGDVLLVAELKSARGGYRSGQEDWLSAFGGVRAVKVATWRPGDLDAIAEALR
jgi:hypothetical protein